MPANVEKKKIAILGGGMASIAAAFELTAPEVSEQHEVTIYQLGWRLGGKGASGRNMQHEERIEEHGLHVWFGFYDNAFRIMQACYKELNRAPDAPLATWQDAFKPASWFVLNEYYDNEWLPWPIEFPTNIFTPGNRWELPLYWQMVVNFLEWAKQIFEKLWKTHSFSTLTNEDSSRTAHEWLDDLRYELGSELESTHESALHNLLEMASKLADARSELKTDVEVQQKFPKTWSKHHQVLCFILNKFKALLHEVNVFIRWESVELRRFFVLFDMGSAMACGISADDLMRRGFHAVDNEEFCDWLRRHGAYDYPTLTLANNPPLKAAYDVAFAFENGDPSKPNMAAGVAINGMLRLALTYRGACYWKMQAGMGDTVFTPFYEVLKRRGVKFKFFHCVNQLKLSEDKSFIQSIEVIPQVELTVGEYDPLVLVKGLACWPSDPLWEQLKDGQKLKKTGVNFEYESNPLGAKAITLQKGKDFDLIVLGISKAALPKICSELIADKSEWQKMIEHVPTVMTQAFQLWVNRNLEELGWPADYSTDFINGSYVEPLDTYSEMSHLIKRENWPAKYNLQNIAYFCGVLADNEATKTQQEATEEAKAHALSYLEKNIKHLWPKATQANSDVLNWDYLIDPTNKTGPERFDAQYWRANFQPTERYVQSFAGSIQHRIASHESGYDNLYLTGDWIKNGFDVGHIEGSVASGMLASRAICGYPTDIVGEQKPWGYGKPT